MTDPSPEEHAHNPMFETFVDPTKADEDQLESLIAYALYKKAKREWSTKFYKDHACRPSEGQRAQYVETWSETVITATRAHAYAALAAYAESVVDSVTPQILREALKGSFWRDVGVGLVSAFCYTIILIVFAVILHLVGIDVLEVFKRIAGQQ